MSFKDSTNYKTIELFWKYWKKDLPLLLFAFLIGPAKASQNVVAPLFVAQAVGQLTRGEAVNMTLVVYAGVALFGGLLLSYWVNLRGDAMLEYHVEQAMYNDCFKYLVQQDYDFYANNFGGALVARADRLIKAYSLFHITLFLDALPQLCSVLFALGVMSYYSPLLGLGTAIFWLVSVIIITILAIRRVPVRRAAVAQQSIQTGELADVVSNAITVKTFAGEQDEMERYHQTNLNRGQAFLKSWRRAVQNSRVIDTLCALLQIMIFVVGIWAVQASRIDLAIFLLFQVYILRIVDSLRSTSITVRQIEGVLGDAEEMTVQLQKTSAIQDPEQPEKSRIHAGEIELRNISFTYPGDFGRPVNLFEKFSLKIKPGEKVGLVGPSGGGKTTITKLLLRFVDVQAGDILIDGQSIRNIRQKDLHHAISYVPQEPLLFHRSIGDNISYGKPQATSKEIEQVAKLAHAHNFIEKLPKGYDTLVGERGIKLSGGQRQRIAIARAMIKPAPILILDEATSALDSESEKTIQSALWELMKDKTALVIAHRLSTIQRLDRIIVLDEGGIVEEGTHKELLASKGLYAKLWKHQSGGFLED